MQKPPPAVVKILKKDPALTWWIKDKDSIDIPFAVESILNYGDWNETKTLLRSVGIKRVKKIFHQQANRKRCNYEPNVKHFFTLYFKRHA